MIRLAGLSLCAVLAATTVFGHDGGGLDDLPRLTVRGDAVLHKPADQLRLRVAVVTEADEATAAVSQNNRRMADVIAAAGGLTPLADDGRISLIRNGTVLEGGIDPQSLTVSTRFQSGDQIVVGKQSWARENLPAFIGAFTSVAVAIITVLLVR